MIDNTLDAFKAAKKKILPEKVDVVEDGMPPSLFHRIMVYVPVIVISIICLAILWLAFKVFGVWSIVGLFVFGGMTYFYTTYALSPPSVFLIDDVHFDDSPDEFHIYRVPVERWSKMKKQGSSDFPLHTSLGLAYFTEGVDLKNDTVNLAHRHYANIDFDSRKSAFDEVKGDAISFSKIANKQALLLQYNLYRGLGDKYRELLGVLDKALFTVDEGPKDDLKAELDQLRSEIKGSVEQLEAEEVIK